MSNNVTVISHQGNLLHAKLALTEFMDNKTSDMLQWTSPKYLCGAVFCEVHVKSWHFINDGDQVHFIASVRFVKIFQDDLSYTCNIKLHGHVTLNNYLNNIKTRDDTVTFCDHEVTHEILHIREPKQLFIYISIELTAQCDIATRISPFASLFEDTELTNFRICGKGGSVAIHSHILAALSPVMKTMLSGDWKETTEGQVQNADTTKETLEHLKEYIYLDKLPKEGIEELLILGVYYEMSDLIHKCTVKLMNKLNDDNVIEMMQFALQYKVDQLQLGILNYIHINMSIDRLCKIFEKC